MKYLKKLIFMLNALMLSAVLLFVACDKSKDEGEPNKPTPDSTKTIDKCNTYGTITEVTCGGGVYGDLWILMDNGTLIRPCAVSYQYICPVELKVGDRVQFSYRKAKDTDCVRSGQMSCCPELPKHIIGIIGCINVIQKNDGDCAPLKIVDNLENQYIHIMEAQIVNNQLQLKIGYSGCSRLLNSDFELLWDKKVVNDEVPTISLMVNYGYGKQTLCQAAFWQDICFDLSKIKKDSTKTYKILIGDKVLIYKQ